VLDTAVIITKFNTKSSKFETHQKLLRDTSAVAIEHMRIAQSDDPMTISDYLAVANNEPRTDGNVNIYFWNVSTQLFVLMQRLSRSEALPQSRRHSAASPSSLKYFYADNPGIHFLVVGFHFERTLTGDKIHKTQSFIYSWIPEGRTALEDGSVATGSGFRVFQLLRTNGATSISHIKMPCDCQAGASLARNQATNGRAAPCDNSLHLLTVSNDFGGAGSDLGEGESSLAGPAGAHIWIFRARALNSDSSMWRLRGEVGFFELVQSLPDLPSISSTIFHIELQGCFFAYLVRNTSFVLPSDAHWQSRGEAGATVHVWRYQGGSVYMLS
jgi:hypothetical protein